MIRTKMRFYDIGGGKMIALQGEYENGILTLTSQAPANKAKVIVIFQDIEKEINNELSTDEAINIFNKYTGCIKRVIDEKAERLEAIDEKYESID